MNYASVNLPEVLRKLICLPVSFDKPVPPSAIPIVSPELSGIEIAARFLMPASDYVARSPYVSGSVERFAFVYSR
jgi:hypothetical protein